MAGRMNTLSITSGRRSVHVSNITLHKFDKLTSDLHKLVLLNHILQLLLLLLTLDSLFLHGTDLICNGIKSVTVQRSESQTSDEVCGSIFEWLIILSSHTLT